MKHEIEVMVSCYVTVRVRVDAGSNDDADAAAHRLTRDAIDDLYEVTGVTLSGYNTAIKGGMNCGEILEMSFGIGERNDFETIEHLIVAQGATE